MQKCTIHKRSNYWEFEASLLTESCCRSSIDGATYRLVIRYDDMTVRGTVILGSDLIDVPSITTNCLCCLICCLLCRYYYNTLINDGNCSTRCLSVRTKAPRTIMAFILNASILHIWLPTPFRHTVCFRRHFYNIPMCGSIRSCNLPR
jgi:hypothetical protein